MSNLKVSESSKKSGLFSKEYGLAMSTVIDSGNPISEEIRHINEAMVNWLEHRKMNCGAIVMAFESAPELHEEIIKYVNLLLNQGVPCFEYMKGSDVSFALLDLQGEVCREFNVKC